MAYSRFNPSVLDFPSLFRFIKSLNPCCCCSSFPCVHQHVFLISTKGFVMHLSFIPLLLIIHVAGGSLLSRGLPNTQGHFFFVFFCKQKQMQTVTLPARSGRPGSSPADTQGNWCPLSKRPLPPLWQLQLAGSRRAGAKTGGEMAAHMWRALSRWLLPPADQTLKPIDVSRRCRQRLATRTDKMPHLYTLLFQHTSNITHSEFDPTRR